MGLLLQVSFEIIVEIHKTVTRRQSRFCTDNLKLSLMSSGFFNRDSQRSVVRRFCDQLSNNHVSTLWIEGQSGVGKSELMELAVEIVGESVFEYELGRKYAKCNEGDLTIDFAMVSNILATIESENPKDFGKSVFQHFDRFATPTLKEALIRAIPGIRGFQWFGDMIGKGRDRHDEAQSFVSERLLNRHLVSMFSDLLEGLLPTIVPSEVIVFAIDDVAWIDEMSLEVLMLATNKLRANNISLSYILTSRDYFSLPDKSRYLTVEKRFRGIASEFINLTLDNLNRDFTKQFLHFCGRSELEHRLDFIYEYTCGNFQELAQTLKFSDESLERLYQNAVSEREPGEGSERSHEGRYLSLEYCRETIERSRLSKFLMGALTALRNSATESRLAFLAISLARTVDQDVVTADHVRATLDGLEKDGIVKQVGKLVVSHDTVLEHVNSILIGTDERTAFWEAIAGALLALETSELSFPFPENLGVAMELIGQTDTRKALDIYINNRDSLRKLGFVPREFLSIAGNCLRQLCDKISDAVLTNEAVPMVCELTLASQFAEAVALGDEVYARVGEIPDERLFAFYYHFLTAMRECDYLKRTDNVSGQHIARLLLNLDTATKFDAVRARLLYCSVLEHLSRFDVVRKIYGSLPKMISQVPDVQERTHATAMYYRNMGLAQYHGDITSELKKGIEAARSLDRDEREQDVLLGTLFNNLGMCHIHADELNEAIKAFKTSLELLNRVQYGPEAPLNNLAVCNILAGKYEVAHEYVRKAIEVPLKGAYQKLAIDTTQSTVFWKLGKRAEAFELLGPIAGATAEVRSVVDPFVRAQAAMTYAYFLFQDERFAEAAQWYQQSIIDEFPYLTEENQQRRRLLVKYCLARAGLDVGQDLGDMSTVVENGTKLLNRPYGFNILALYIN